MKAVDITLELKSNEHHINKNYRYHLIRVNHIANLLNG